MISNIYDAYMWVCGNKLPIYSAYYIDLLIRFTVWVVGVSDVTNIEGLNTLDTVPDLKLVTVGGVSVCEVQASVLAVPFYVPVVEPLGPQLVDIC